MVLGAAVHDRGEGCAMRGLDTASGADLVAEAIREDAAEVGINDRLLAASRGAQAAGAWRYPGRLREGIAEGSPVRPAGCPQLSASAALPDVLCTGRRGGAVLMRSERRWPRALPE